VGDAIWAAADQRARGFLLGATSGRTTLGGEGLQHQDGSSHLVAATIPNCKAWDPAFAGELAVILDAGMREMLIDQQDVFHYITLMNESYAQPDLPEGAAQGVLRGGYLFKRFEPRTTPSTPDADTWAATPLSPRVTLMGSGAILTEVIKAAQALAESGVAVEVLSITSWSELARDAEKAAETSAEESTRPSPEAWLTTLLAHTSGPVIATSDYVRAVPECLRAWLPKGMCYRTLGTDGFGRSDTRATLRAYFKVDAAHIEVAARKALQGR
jgi:pyruvate dehydrogenase E1 component